ncbi:MAG: GIDE domain-containing protein [archaeon]
MNLIPFGITVAVGIGLSVYPIWRIKKLNKLIKEITMTKNVSVGDLTNGKVEIEGTALQTSTGALLSPVTKTPCLYYKCSVTESVGSGKSRRIIVLLDEIKAVPFFVDDQTGKVVVDPTGATIITAKSSVFRTGLFGKPTQALFDFFTSRHINYNGLLGLKRDLTCGETIIPFGEKVFVKGIAREKDEVDLLKLPELANNAVYIPKNLEEPTKIALGGENAAIGQYKKQVWLTIAILILILFLVGIFAAITLIVGLKP